MNLQQAHSGPGTGPKATDFLDAIPNARGNPDAEMELVKTILQTYGSEDHFFQAAASELEVSPDDIKDTLMMMVKAPPDSNGASANFQSPPNSQNTPEQNMDSQDNSQVLETKGQPMPVPNAPQPPMNMNNRMQPPPQTNPSVMNANSSGLQGQGMAPAQAQNQAAQMQQQPMGFKKGGQVTATPGAPTNDMLGGKHGLDKAHWFDKIKFALSQTPAGKNLLNAELHEKSSQLPSPPSGTPLPQHKPPVPSSGGDLSKGFNDQEAPGLDIEKATSGEYAAGGFVQDTYSPNEQGPSMGYADGGTINDSSDSPPNDSTNGNDFADGAAMLPEGDEELPATSENEQADNIPAKLSENEFVMPAYAVKYWGIAHLNGMLKEAHSEMGEMEGDGEVSDDDAPTEEGVEEKAKGGFIKKPPQKLKKGGEVKKSPQKLACGGMPQKMKKGGFLGNAKELSGGTPTASLPSKPFEASSIKKLTRQPRQSRTFHLPKGGNFKAYGTAKLTTERLPNTFTK